MRSLLTKKKVRNLVFELCEGEDAPGQFAKLLQTDPYFLTGNWLLAGLPFRPELFQTKLDGLHCKDVVIYVNNAADVLLLALKAQQLVWGTRCLPCASLTRCLWWTKPIAKG